jgi:SAM-dependent methyltransferase
MDTRDTDYTERLLKLEPKWKRLLDVQRPYRRHLQSLGLGLVLDIGCGLGRNLINLGGGNAGVGIDHNRHSVELARNRGLTAFTPEEFASSVYAGTGVFDAILMSHVAEHMNHVEAVALLKKYLGCLRIGGRVVLITPQERGFKSDATHVEFVDFAAQEAMAHMTGLNVVRQYSFPLPRVFGRFFTYNEFITICRKD